MANKKSKKSEFRYDGAKGSVSFNKQWLQSVSEKDFMENQKGGSLSEEELKEAYQLSRPKEEVSNVVSQQPGAHDAAKNTASGNKSVGKK